jgi:NAD(P)-dependent dehydrogenase (short-subunit alcohol dehydrogenase family)
VSEIRFDGQVAIVTGAGGGIGREEALLLARRGAAVVVNDLGGAPDGAGAGSPEPAQIVAEEIRAMGGRAIANCASVADEAGAASIVRDAIDAFGRVDILINNAGIMMGSPFAAVRRETFEQVVAVHLLGTFLVSKAAWPIMAEQHYGRIVNTSSHSILGYAGMCGYTAAKGAIFSMTRGLALEGGPFGIAVNTLLPGAASRMMQNPVTSDDERAFMSRLPPEGVAPVAAYLAHFSCPLNGEAVGAVGGNVHRVFFGRTRGYTNPDLTIEDVQTNLDEILSLDASADPMSTNPAVEP